MKKDLGQKDYLDECMEDTGVVASIEQFQMAFCHRCLNSACIRSKANELLWTKRMDRQVKALYDPDFGDMRDPKNLILAKQDFKTLDTSVIRVGNWEAPQKPVVHHATPPTETQDSTKTDKSVSNLERARGKEPLPQQESIKVQEPVEKHKSTSDDFVPTQQEPQNMPQTPYNTSMPVGGLLLGGQGVKPTPEKEDMWAVKGKKEKIVVNLGSGEVKKTTK